MGDHQQQLMPSIQQLILSFCTSEEFSDQFHMNLLSLDSYIFRLSFMLFDLTGEKMEVGQQDDIALSFMF